MSKKESNAAPDIARPVPPPAPPARALSCVTHHHACDCREAEWAQKMAAQQARIEELEAGIRKHKEFFRVDTSYTQEDLKLWALLPGGGE